MKVAKKYSLILSAATKVFAKKGFYNARISDIAKEAKVADGTIYLYFNNKHDILISVFEKELEVMLSAVQKNIESENDPQLMLKFFIENHLKTMKKKKFFAEVLHTELRLADKVIKDYRNKKFSEYLNLIVDIIEQGQTKNIFRSDLNPDIIKRIIFGTLDEVSRVWNNSFESHYSVEETLTQLYKVILPGLKK